MNSTENICTIKSTEKSNYNSIDVVKFLCAILIFAIHIEPFPSGSFEYADYLNNLTQNYICRLAVPFYFTASGFFLFKKMDLENLDFSIIKKYCHKILMLFGIWSIVLYTTLSGHLWYLKSLIIAVLFISLLLKNKVKFKHIAILSVVLYVIGLLGDAYHGIIRNIGENNFLGFLSEQYNSLFGTTRNGLFMGVIFVLIGAAFSKKMISIKTTYSVIGFVISMGLLLVEVFLIKHFDLAKDTNMFICLVPATIFLFNALLKIEIKDNKIYPRLRVIGMLIYYSHRLVEAFVEQFFVNIEDYFEVDCSNYLFITTLVCVVIFATFIERISQKEKFKWLQYLYK